MERRSKTASLRKKEEKQVLWTFSTQRYRGTEKNGLFFTGQDSRFSPVQIGRETLNISIFKTCGR
jgi:hypothetical protein